MQDMNGMNSLHGYLSLALGHHQCGMNRKNYAENSYIERINTESKVVKFNLILILLGKKAFSSQSIESFMVVQLFKCLYCRGL